MRRRGELDNGRAGRRDHRGPFRALSHGRTGQCWDNALAESFFASLKGELPGLQPWRTRAAARRAVVEYIAWYNGTRLHSTLGYRSPAEYEEQNKIKKVA